MYDDDDYEMDDDDYDKAYDSLTEESRRENEIDRIADYELANSKSKKSKELKDEIPTRYQSVDTNLGNKRWAKRFLDDMKDDD
tara:strand:- start:259 stop:507 length:249 start_codon:yes stop_codon:yes gene_type:complete